SFSGVTWLNSRFRIVVYAVSLSLLAATAVPKYRPDWAAEAPRVVAASAVLARAITKPPVSAAAAAVAIAGPAGPLPGTRRGAESLLMRVPFGLGRWRQGAGLPPRVWVLLSEGGHPSAPGCWSGDATRSSMSLDERLSVASR